MKSYNFILPTLALLIVIQISYVLGASTLKTDLDPNLNAESESELTEVNSRSGKPQTSSLTLIKRNFEIADEEDPSESQLRQKRHFYRIGGLDPYSGAIYGVGYGRGWGWGGYYGYPRYGSYRRYGYGWGGYY